MTHTELTSLWKKQCDQYQSWEVALINKAEVLRKKIEDILQPPAEVWEDRQNHNE